MKNYFKITICEQMSKHDHFQFIPFCFDVKLKIKGVVAKKGSKKKKKWWIYISY